MAIKLGTTSASLYLGNTPVAAYLGATQVYSAGAPDPSFANVSLLLHFDGANESTTFTDSSSNALTVTGQENAQISTAQFKFGGASGRFDGALTAVSASDAALDISTGNFTIEMWMRFDSVSSGQQPASGYLSNTPDNWAFFTTSAGRLDFYLANSFAWDIASGVEVGSITANTWHHVALVRSGSSFTAFLDGVAGGTVTSGSNLAQGNAVFLGSSPTGSSPFAGYIDDLRVTKGVARYTEAFTPPAAAFPDS